MSEPLKPQPAAQGPLDDLLEHADWIHGLARNLVRDPATADDLAQETWSAALEHPLPHPRLTSARPWLAAVMRNRWRSWLRGDGRREARERAVAASEALPPESEMLERMERQRALLEHVVSLGEPYRRTVILRYYEDLSTTEIARRTGEPHERVRWRLRRAHELLRDRLRREHGPEMEAWCGLLLPLAERAPRLAPQSPQSPAATAAATTVTAGVLLMNAKLPTAVAAILIGVGVTFWLARSPAPAAPERAEPAPALALRAPPGAEPTPSAHAAEWPALVGVLPEGFARMPVSREPEEEVVAPSGTLSGRVIAEENGAPIPGARLVLLTESETPAHRHDEALLEVRADASGAFTLTAVPPGDYHLSCRSPGRAPTLLRGVLVPAGERELEVLLARGARLDVTVTEAATGLPVAGAEVLAIAGDKRSVSIVSTAGVQYHSVTGSSDGSGLARIAGVARGETQLVVRAAGFASWIGALRIRDDSASAEVALLRGCTLRGRVTRADGLGAAGTSVFLNPSKLKAALPVYEFVANGIAVEADGSFMIPFAPAGEHYVVAVAPDGAAGFHVDRRGELQAVGLAEGEETWLDLVIPAPASLEGRVLDHEGAPVEGAKLSISWGDFKPPDTGFFPLHLVKGSKESTHQITRTDAEGRFRMEAVRPSYEPLTIRVRAEGHQGAEFEVEPRAGELIEHDVVLASLSSTISGRLATADGAGVPGVTVGAWAWSGDERGDLFLAQSSADGSFEIAVPEHPERFEIWPILRDHDAYTSTPEKRAREQAGASALHFELSARHFIEGEVVDGQGTPVPGFAITLTEPDQELPRLLRNVDLGGGHFRFPWDGARFGGAIFTAPGFATERRERPDPGVHLRIVLARAPDLCGRVIAPDGSGLEGALVCMATLDDLAFPIRSRHTPAARTDSDGRFVLQGVPALPGTMLLVAPERPGLPPLVRRALDDVRGGEVLVQVVEPVEVVLETSGSRVLAIDALGWPLHPEVEQVLADLRASEAADFGAVHGGRAVLWLTPGDYHFLAAGADGVPVVSDLVRVEAGAPIEVTLP